MVLCLLIIICEHLLKIYKIIAKYKKMPLKFIKMALNITLNWGKKKNQIRQQNKMIYSYKL